MLDALGTTREVSNRGAGPDSGGPKIVVLKG